jgi:hypothetical protein
MMCVLATIAVGLVLAFITYDKATDYGTLSDNYMSGPGY